MERQTSQGLSSEYVCGQTPFGHYRIEEKIGEGGMGSVYRAYDLSLERTVALKIPFFQDDQQGDVRERFLREARAAAKLHHRNICPVYQIGRIDGFEFISMSYIRGRSLCDLIDSNKRLDLDRALRIIRGVALAMAHAHNKEVVHRDLKPANILIDEDGEPVVMDFGIAIQLGESSRLTKEGFILGTPAYMSPEQISGDPSAVGPSSDIYSLGVILYELLTGRPPFDGPVGAMFGQIMTREPSPPSTIRHELDPEIDDVCVRMMAKAPEDRPASMEAVAEWLTNLLDQIDAKASSISQTKRSAADFAPGQQDDTMEETQPMPSSMPPLRGDRNGSKWKKLALIGGVAGFLILLTLVTFFKNRNSDNTAELKHDPKPPHRINETDPETKEPGKPAAIEPDNPEQKAAEWVLNKGGKLWVGKQGPEREVSELREFLEIGLPIKQVFFGEKASVNNDSLKNIANLSELQILDFHGTPITDAGLVHLKKLSRLERVSLHSMNITDQGLRHLVPLQNLTHLQLFKASGVTGEGMEVLKPLQKLELINLHGTQVDDRGLDSLAELPRLKDLNLYSTKVSDLGMEALAKIKTLQVLILENTSITDDCVPQLSKLKSLKQLNLRRTGLTSNGFEALQAALPNAVIETSLD